MKMNHSSIVEDNEQSLCLSCEALVMSDFCCLGNNSKKAMNINTNIQQKKQVKKRMKSYFVIKFTDSKWNTAKKNCSYIDML